MNANQFSDDSVKRSLQWEQQIKRLKETNRNLFYRK